MKAEDIARVCHEANRALTLAIADVPTQPHWDFATEDMQTSCIKGVEWRLQNPNAPAGMQHEVWMAERIAQGWTLGPVKDNDLKKHPALVPFDELPELVKQKDRIFSAIVNILRKPL